MPRSSWAFFLRKIFRWPVSRVMSSRSPKRSQWMTIHLGGLLPARSCNLPERRSGRRAALSPGRSFLFDFAPGGVYPASPVTSGAVRSYRTLSPLPDKSGGLLSVALSLRSPSPVVNRHRSSVVPGLSSPARRRQQPSGHLNDLEIIQNSRKKQKKMNYVVRH